MCCVLFYYLYLVRQPPEHFVVRVKAPVGDCAICLEPMDLTINKGEGKVVGQKCNHLFHHRCLTQWRSYKNSTSHLCPLCKVHVPALELSRIFTYE